MTGWLVLFSHRCVLTMRLSVGQGTVLWTTLLIKLGKNVSFFFLVLFAYFDGKLIAGTFLSSYFVTTVLCLCYAVRLLVYTSSEILTRAWFSGIYMTYCQNKKMKGRKKLCTCCFFFNVLQTAKQLILKSERSGVQAVSLTFLRDFI